MRKVNTAALNLLLYDEPAGLWEVEIGVKAKL